MMLRDVGLGEEALVSPFPPLALLPHGRVHTPLTSLRSFAPLSQSEGGDMFFYEPSTRCLHGDAVMTSPFRMDERGASAASGVCAGRRGGLYGMS